MDFGACDIQEDTEKAEKLFSAWEKEGSVGSEQSV